LTPENFTFWLNGFFELSPVGQGLTPEQVQVIKDHLALVFEKKTPMVSLNRDYNGNPFPNPTKTVIAPWADLNNTPICSSAPQISFDGREPVDLLWDNTQNIWVERTPKVGGGWDFAKPNALREQEKAAEDIFPPNLDMGQLNVGGNFKVTHADGKPPASC
jgi:hypothetical protein